MKEKINLLFYMDINKYLPNEKYDYYVIEDNEQFVINELSPNFNSYSTILKDYLAYDFDKLSEVHKVLFMNKHKEFYLIKDNIYKRNMELYNTKKKHL